MQEEFCKKFQSILIVPVFFYFADSRAFIQDSPDMHVQIGSRIVLTCHVRQASGPPEYVFWYRGSDVLNYSPLVKIEDFYREDESSAATEASSNREGGSNFIFDTLQFHQKSEEEEEENSNGEQQVISRLSVEDVERVKDSGNYTCAPSNARSTSIMVHVVDGKIHVNIVGNMELRLHKSSCSQGYFLQQLCLLVGSKQGKPDLI